MLEWSSEWALRPPESTSLQRANEWEVACLSLARPTKLRKGLTSSAVHFTPLRAHSTGAVPEPLNGSITAQVFASSAFRRKLRDCVSDKLRAESFLYRIPPMSR